LAGKVKVEGEIVYKAGKMVLEDSCIDISQPDHPFVSRGGLKLEQALKLFEIPIAGKTAIDIGASTGGFTDCLLQYGASKVIAIDVGYGQFDWKLRTDSRVRLLERQNIRYLTSDALGELADIAVLDVSFISLKLVLPPTFKLLKPKGEVIALVKPQFEVGKNEVEKKGIVKSPDKHLKVLLKIKEFTENLGWHFLNLIPSPITGQKGNIEFLVHLGKENQNHLWDENAIQNVVNIGCE
jgi:23S rRNA (cytidine1920-2'-O)/16S rRNA (cytidine1409-2'-O)-methyltransferase